MVRVKAGEFMGLDGIESRIQNVECRIAKLFAGSGFLTQRRYYIMHDPPAFNLMDKVGQIGTAIRRAKTKEERKNLFSSVEFLIVSTELMMEE